MVQAVLGREINPVVMTMDKLLAQLRKKDRFATRVLEEPKLFVIGGEDEFAKFIEDKTAG